MLLLLNALCYRYTHFFLAKGREILEDTKHLVEKLQYEVIYGDTDSLMINTNILEYDDVFSIGRKVRKIIHRMIL